MRGIALRRRFLPRLPMQPMAIIVLLLAGSMWSEEILYSGIVSTGTESNQTKPLRVPPVCGSERWAVKTLSDDDAPKMKLDNAVGTTVKSLNELEVRCKGGLDKRIWPEEFEVYELTGKVIQVRGEQDRDLHIVIADLDHPEYTIIVEVADPECAGAADSPHVAVLTRARRMATSLLRTGKTTDSKPLVGRVVRVRGVGFFDFDHGQGGRSRSCIELHPVVVIEPVFP